MIEIVLESQEFGGAMKESEKEKRGRENTARDEGGEVGCGMLVNPHSTGSHASDPWC